MRSRRPAVACNDVFRQADGSTERQQSLRQAYGESDPAKDVSHILTGLRNARSEHQAGRTRDVSLLVIDLTGTKRHVEASAEPLPS